MATCHFSLTCSLLELVSLQFVRANCVYFVHSLQLEHNLELWSFSFYATEFTSN